MIERRFLPRPPLLLMALATAGTLACGSRTGLLVGAELVGESETDGMVSVDASPDVTHAADAREPEKDATDEDVPPPPIVVSNPQPAPSDCPDAGSTLIYLISQRGSLMSFYPPTATFRTIGQIACPAPSRWGPFSMAVDRTGIAYVLFTFFNDQQGDPSANQEPSFIFRVSTATASCRATSFVSGSGFSSTFGMGFSADVPGTGETLFVASDEDPDGGLPRLGSIDTSTFRLRVIGDLPQSANRAELTGTGAGDLFGFYGAFQSNESSNSLIGQINKVSAHVTGQSTLTGVMQGQAWAFAFWGGDFYTFTEPLGAMQTVVTRFRPSDGSLVQVAQTPEVVVGAGVSTCAPQQ